MARKKKITRDNTENYELHILRETVSNVATHNEKVSWNRKANNLAKLIEELRPIEEQISDLLVIKQEIIDKVTTLRTTMVNECVHPYEYLIQLDDHLLECKFCFKKINIKI